jgi:hypothetical protein
MTDILMNSGKQGSGKTTLTNAILKNAALAQYDQVHTFKFADSLYELHDTICNKTRRFIEAGDHSPEAVVYFVFNDLMPYILNKMEGWTGLRPDAVVIAQLRTYLCDWVMFRIQHGVLKKEGPLLQYLGTEFGRNGYGVNVWVDILKKKLAPYMEPGPTKLLISIDDCRFENEFDAFPEALRVRLECPEEIRKVRADSWRDNSNHPSEVGLDAYADAGKFDMYFDTEFDSVNHCRDLILAQLQKKNWIEKRS